MEAYCGNNNNNNYQKIKHNISPYCLCYVIQVPGRHSRIYLKAATLTPCFLGKISAAVPQSEATNLDEFGWHMRAVWSHVMSEYLATIAFHWLEILEMSPEPTSSLGCVLNGWNFTFQTNRPLEMEFTGPQTKQIYLPRVAVLFRLTSG